MMKNKFVKIGVVITGTLAIVGFFSFQNDSMKQSIVESEIPVYTMHADYSIDVNNPNETVGDSDYVFVAEVLEENGTVYKDRVLIENADGTMQSVGDAYTQYTVSVVSNLKNELVVDVPIHIEKMGGIREDGSAYDIFEDDELPKVGETYVFIAYTQDDGSLLVSGANSNIPFDERASAVDTEAEVAKTSEFKEYEEAVENQVETDREKLESDYDVENQPETIVETY